MSRKRMTPGDGEDRSRHVPPFIAETTWVLSRLARYDGYGELADMLEEVAVEAERVDDVPDAACTH
jgi:hypothetical protein